jgi:two-component system nitrogen regulation response regulator GlnG
VVRHLVIERRGGRNVTLASLPLELREPPARPLRSAVAALSTEPLPGSASRVTETLLIAASRENRWRTAAAARQLGISRSTLYALIDRSASLRKAKGLDAAELWRCFAECAGDVEAMSERLEVSARGLRLRLRELAID